MPKISNKGFGFIPVLLLSLLIGVVALGGYTLYNKENVLPANTQLAQVRPSPITSSPNRNVAKVSLDFNATPNKYETGNITLKVTSDSKNINELNLLMRKYPLIVQDYCMTAVCPKPRNVRPTVKIVNNSNLLVEVPVTPMVRSVSFTNNTDVKLPAFEFENNLKGWFFPIKLGEGQIISLQRENQALNVGITLRSANSSNGQENFLVYINGIGDDTAELIRTIRTTGIKRMDLVGNRVVTTAIKPNVVYDGQGRFNITALNNTKTFYVSPSRRLNAGIDPIPTGWVKNKNGDGVDKTRVGLPSRISITEVKTRGSLDSTFNFVVKAGTDDMQKIISTIKNKGITVTRCTSEQSCYYPVQKPNVVCGDYQTVGCRFSVKVPNLATYIWINYEPGNLVNSVIELAPKGWRDNTNGTGINKF